MDVTLEERASARSLVHTILLEQLLVLVLARADDPLDEANALETLARADLEAVLAASRGRGADITQHLAAEYFDGIWARVTAELASQVGPVSLDFAPHSRNPPGKGPGAEPPVDDGEGPDR